MQGDLVFAQRAERVFEMDFPLVEGDVELMLQLIGNHAGGDGAEQLTILARLDLDDTDQFGNAFGELAHGVELVRLAFGAALLERLEAALVRATYRNSESLRKQIIARVARGDADLVGFTAE